MGQPVKQKRKKELKEMNLYVYGQLQIRTV